MGHPWDRGSTSSWSSSKFRKGSTVQIHNLRSLENIRFNGKVGRVQNIDIKSSGMLCLSGPVPLYTVLVQCPDPRNPHGPWNVVSLSLPEENLADPPRSHKYSPGGRLCRE